MQPHRIECAVILLGRGGYSSLPRRQLEQLAAAVRAVGRYGLVLHAFVDQGDTSLPDALDTCVAAGAQRVIVQPIFIPGDANRQVWLAKVVRRWQAQPHDADLVVVMGQSLGDHAALAGALEQALDDAASGTDQENAGEFDFSVREMVLMGRSPYKRLLDRDTAVDLALVEQALAQLGMTSFAERSFLTLSGGEKQHVLVARALAQQTHFLVLDEPTNHLDIRYQLEILDLVRGLDVTTIAAMHDLNLAALYCDYLYVLSGGVLVWWLAVRRKWC